MADSIAIHLKIVLLIGGFKMDMVVGDFLLNLINQGAVTLLETKGGELLNSIHTVVYVTLILSITIYGVLIMTGDMASSGKKLLITCLWVVVAMEVTNPEFYFNFVITTVIQTKNNLASFLLAGDNGNTLFEGLSVSFSKIFGHALALIDSGGMTNLAPVLAGLSIFVIYGIYYASIVANLLFCDLVIYVLFLLGLMIIPLSAFQTFRGIFKSWVTIISKYCLVFIISAMIISLLNNVNTYLIQQLLIESYQNGEVESGILSPYFGATLLMGIFGAYLMTKAMELSGELTGGAMSDGSTGMKSISNTVKSGLNGLNQGSNMAGKGIKALKAARAAKVAG